MGQQVDYNKKWEFARIETVKGVIDENMQVASFERGDLSIWLYGLIPLTWSYIFIYLFLFNVALQNDAVFCIVMGRRCG